MADNSFGGSFYFLSTIFAKSNEIMDQKPKSCKKSSTGCFMTLDTLKFWLSLNMNWTAGHFCAGVLDFVTGLGLSQLFGCPVL